MAWYLIWSQHTHKNLSCDVFISILLVNVGNKIHETMISKGNILEQHDGKIRDPDEKEYKNLQISKWNPTRNPNRTLYKSLKKTDSVLHSR